MGVPGVALWAILSLLFAGVGAAAAVDEVSHECSSAGNRVTVLVNVKESPQFTEALDNVLRAVPPSVKVLIFPFIPTLHDATREQIMAAADTYENVELISHNEPYLTLGESRKWVVSSGLVETKYLLCVENIAYFNSGFVERMLAKMELIREKEMELFGEEKSAVLIPRLIERCEERESMWTRSHFKSHAEFLPFTCHIEDVLHLVHGWIAHRSEVHLLDDEDGSYPNSAEGELSKKAREWLADEATGNPSPARHIQYIDYLEDHVVLFETAFLKEHIHLLGHPDIMWMDDHITEALIVFGAGKKVSLALDEVAYLEFFCSFNLEVLPIIAWKRSAAYMQRSCDIEERLFGAKPAQNCWHWPLVLKRTLFRSIRVPDVVEEFPSFAPGRDLAGLRHANLIMGALMAAERNQFQFVVTSLDGNEETHWMEPTEALVYLYRLKSTRRDPSLPKRELYVRSKSEFVDITSDSWREAEKRAGRDLTSNSMLPGVSTLTQWETGSQFVTNVFTRDLPNNCLFYTGDAELSPKLQEALSSVCLLSLRITDAQGESHNSYFTWATNVPSCPPTMRHPALRLLSDSDLIRLPSTHDDSSVQVRSFNYRSFSLE